MYFTRPVPPARSWLTAVFHAGRGAIVATSLSSAVSCCFAVTTASAIPLSFAASIASAASRPAAASIASADSVSSAATVVEGVIYDSPGHPSKLAYAEVMKWDERTRISIVRAGAGGNYRLPPLKPGVYYVRLSAVNRASCSVPIVVNAGAASYRIDAHLAPYNLPAAIDSIGIVGDWNGFDSRQPTPMTRETDGTFDVVREALADTLAYQLTGLVAEGRTINGPQADYYDYDGGGDYRSVIRTQRGAKVRVVLDPRLLPRGSGQDQPSFEFGPKNGWGDELRQMRAEVQKDQDGRLRAEEEYGKTHPGREGFTFDESNILSALARKVRESDRREVRQFAVHCLQWIPDTTRVAPPLLAQILKVMPLNSELWESAPEYINHVIYSLPKTEREGAWQRALRENPSRTVQGVALAGLLESAEHRSDGTGSNKAEIADLYRRLKDHYSGIEEVSSELSECDPDRAIQPGKPVPVFEVTLMETGEKVTDQSLRGKYYLIDFWATWCAPCVGEMANLHAAYDRFRGRNFTILSISLDGAPRSVTAFRAGKWKMPWMNAFVPGLFDSDVAKAFKVQGIPKPILVGPDGVILEDGSVRSLRGTDLFATLEKQIPSPSGGK